MPRIINLVFILSVLVFVLNDKLYTKKNGIICDDIISYYTFLPATFIYDDITLEFMKKEPGKWHDKFWPLISPTQKRVVKMSMGLSFMYAPFFFTAHIIAKTFEFQPDGFSSPYQLLLVISYIFYLLIGLYYLRKFLLQYFSVQVVTLTLLAICFGTNLFWHGGISSSPMSHPYLFSLFSAFLYFASNWVDKPTWGKTLIIGFISGLITLIRPTDIIILLFLLLWNVTSFKAFGLRIRFFLNNFLKILLMIVAFIIVWIPQMLYWKKVTGSFFYFSYGNEGFFFLNPHIVDGLFGYRNGWLVYTPIMIFALIGIYFLRKRFPQYFWFYLTFVVLNIYLILSWWCWWYVGFGNRAFIDSYSLLAFPLALFIDISLKKKMYYKIPIISIFIVLIFLNIFQSFQYKKHIISCDSMTSDAYWANFLKLQATPEYFYALESPDYKKAIKGITDVEINVLTKVAKNPFVLKYPQITCDAETKTPDGKYFYSKENNAYTFYCGHSQTSDAAHSGKYSVILNKDVPYGLEVRLKNVDANLKLNISVWYKSNVNKGTFAISDLETKDFYFATDKIVKTDDAGWKKVEEIVTIPVKMDGKDVKIYVWNKDPNEPAYFDDFTIKFIPPENTEEN